MQTNGMTPEQKELARRALGLPNKQRKSCRNRVVTGPGGSDYDAWMAMVEAGCAKRRDDLFWLTRQGAEAALEGREKLCSEDFPDRTNPPAKSGLINRRLNAYSDQLEREMIDGNAAEVMNNLVSLRQHTIADIPAMLRQMAEAIESGEHGRVTSAIFVLPGDTGLPAVFGWGDTQLAGVLLELDLARRALIDMHLEG